MNLGVEGDRIEHILWRILNGEVDHGAPKLGVVLAGTVCFEMECSGVTLLEVEGLQP